MDRSRLQRVVRVAGPRVLAIGILLGIAIAKIVEWKTPLPAAIAPWSIVMATLLGTVVGIISGVYPARRAASLDPIEALRKE